MSISQARSVPHSFAIASDLLKATTVTNQTHMTLRKRPPATPGSNRTINIL